MNLQSVAEMTSPRKGNKIDVITAANDWNIVVANFAAVWVGTSAGDMDYYTSATAKTRLAIGAANTFIRSFKPTT